MDRIQETIISSSWKSKKLRVVGTGSGSPCIDLRRISIECNEESKNVDLVVLEGMGRAIHTNFKYLIKIMLLSLLRCHFNCDSLKIAVVKNISVGELIDASLYDGICLFEPKNQSGSIQ